MPFESSYAELTSFMSESSHPASPDEIRAQLARVVSSGVLAGSDQLKRLLRLVVERTLNSQGETLKEYNLGLEVFGRPPDYDPKSDPIVRVQARRLRARNTMPVRELRIR